LSGVLWMACEREGGVGRVASGALTVNDLLPVLLQRRNRESAPN